MRMTDNNFGSNLRLALAIAATTGIMICLWLIVHSCTPATLNDDRSTGTGIALRLGTVSMESGSGKGGGKAQTRALSAITTMSAWEFADGDHLNVSVHPGGDGATASTGVYSYTAAGGWQPQSPENAAYWQKFTGNTVSIQWGPAADGKVYHLPGSYDAAPDSDTKAKLWNGTKCTDPASLWRHCDLLLYQASEQPAQNTAISVELLHCMAQLCVELTPGKDMTQSELKEATVSILGAYGCYTINAATLKPVPCAADAATTASPATKDITLLKNGYKSLKHYALLLPGQTFPTTAPMIKINVNGASYHYTPNADVTPAAGHCLNLKLQVDKTAVSGTVSVSSTGWDSDVTTGGTPTEDKDVTVISNTSAGSLTLPDNLPSTDAKLMITGEINSTDLETIKSNMGKFSELYINATLSGETTTLPDNFVQYNDNLKAITLPKGLTGIGTDAFYRCIALTSVSLPEGITNIGKQAFCLCATLTSINLPEKLESIGESAFESCEALTSISLPEGITSIGEEAFGRCIALTSISLPKGITSIERFTFSNCRSLSSVSLPEGVTSIGNEAFFYCDVLTSISLPKGITSIGNKAFGSCSSLRKVIVNSNTLPTCGTDAFSTNTFPALFLPHISAEDFAAAPDTYLKWGNFGNYPWSAVHYAYSPDAGTTPDDYANPDNYLGHWPETK